MSVQEIVDGIGPTIGEHHNGNGNVYLAHKIIKLQKLHNDVDPDCVVSNILKGCVIFVNGRTGSSNLINSRFYIVLTLDKLQTRL